jgi:SseB protein N-terminal domain
MNLSSRCGIVGALEAFARHASKANRAACVDAFASAVVFLCAPVGSLERTGQEPLFRVAKLGERRVLLHDVAEADRVEIGASTLLYVFSTRKAADAWSQRVHGFAAEPVAASVAVGLARRAKVRLVIDPLETAFVPSQAELDWEPQRASSGRFDQALEDWLRDRSENAFDLVKQAFRDQIFFIMVTAVGASVEPQANASANEWGLVTAGDRQMVVVLEGDTWLLPANTDRTAVERASADLKGTVCLGIDGPAVAEAVTLTRVELGVEIGRQKKLALSAKELEAEWPRRPLTTGDF